MTSEGVAGTEASIWPLWGSSQGYSCYGTFPQGSYVSGILARLMSIKVGIEDGGGDIVDYLEDLLTIDSEVWGPYSKTESRAVRRVSKSTEAYRKHLRI